MKIENRSRKRSHKLDGIGVGRIRTVPFSSDSAYDCDAYDPVKTRLVESQAEVLGLFFGFRLRLLFSIFTRSEALTTPTPTQSPVKTSLKELKYAFHLLSAINAVQFAAQVEKNSQGRHACK